MRNNMALNPYNGNLSCHVLAWQTKNKHKSTFWACQVQALCVYIYEYKDCLLIDLKAPSSNPTMRHSKQRLHRYTHKNLWYSSSTSQHHSTLMHERFCLYIVHIVHAIQWRCRPSYLRSSCIYVCFESIFHLQIVGRIHCLPLTLFPHLRFPHRTYTLFHWFLRRSL